MQVRQHVCIDISDSYREKTMQNIEAHKLRAYDQYPHWSVRMFKMKMVIGCCYEGREVPTAATDGTHIFVNPEFWWGLDIELRTFLLVHEVAHVMLGHPWRRGARDHYCWNVAGDEIINYILYKQAQSMGRSVTIPDAWIFPPAEREGWSEERVYAEIFEEDNTVPEPTQPEGNPGCTQEGQTSPSEEGDAGESQKQPGDTQNTQKEDKPHPPGEVWDGKAEDGSEATEEDCEKAIEEVARDLQQGEKIAKMQGHGTHAGARRAIDRLTKPRFDWESYLTTWVKQKGRPIGRSWSRPDRRYLAQDIIMPHEVKSGIDWIVFALDISGSMNWPVLNQLIAHIELIRSSTRIERITFLPFHHTISNKQVAELGPDDDFPKNIDVGGGTRYAQIFNWIRRFGEGQNPDAVIIFTDLYCSDYGEPVDSSILWASSEPVYDGDWRSNRPPFGDAIEIDIHH